MYWMCVCVRAYRKCSWGKQDMQEVFGLAQLTARLLLSGLLIQGKRCGDSVILCCIYKTFYSKSTQQRKHTQVQRKNKMFMWSQLGPGWSTTGKKLWTSLVTLGCHLIETSISFIPLWGNGGTWSLMKQGSVTDKPHTNLLHNGSKSPLQREQSCNVRVGQGIKGGYVRTTG